jgi:hypothetical protein
MSQSSLRGGRGGGTEWKGVSQGPRDVVDVRDDPGLEPREPAARRGKSRDPYTRNGETLT